MGSKSAIVFLGEGRPLDALREPPELDAARSAALAAELLGGPVVETGRHPLDEAAWPGRGTVTAAAFAGFYVIAHQDLALDRPGDLTDWILPRSRGACGVFMHSVVDFGAFAVWEDGSLRRSISLSPDSGIMEDVGERYPFEAPFWAGALAVTHAPEYPLPFHPLDFGNTALAELFGFVIEGSGPPGGIDRDEVLLPAFRLAD